MSEHRCRACGANDIEALADEVAAEMWARHRDRETDPAWEDASPYWQMIMRQHARATIEVITGRGL